MKPTQDKFTDKFSLEFFTKKGSEGGNKTKEKLGKKHFQNMQLKSMEARKIKKLATISTSEKDNLTK